MSAVQSFKNTLETSILPFLSGMPLVFCVSDTYPEELLGSGNDVSNDDRCTKWIDDMLVVWVKDESADNLAYRTVRVRFEE